MKIFKCRFVNNETGNVFPVYQYGESEDEISVFWKGHLSNEYTFIDVKECKVNNDYRCMLEFHETIYNRLHTGFFGRVRDVFSRILAKIFGDPRDE